jgi:hypothetical protein
VVDGSRFVLNRSASSTAQATSARRRPWDARDAAINAFEAVGSVREAVDSRRSLPKESRASSDIQMN